MTDATSPRGGDRRVAYLALLGCTIGVGAVTFALSFVGLRDYAERVAGFDHSLSWLVPVGVDGLTLCAVAATMILRHASWHVRLYAWMAFGVAVVTSVAGNLSHAQAQSLTWQGQIGAGAWPVFLALSSHLVIVVRRNMERAKLRDTGGNTGSDVQRDSSEGKPPTPPRQPWFLEVPAYELPIVPLEPEPDATEPPTEPRPPQTARRVKRATARSVNGRGNDLAQRRARKAWEAGERDLTALAKQLKVSRRSVERYVADLRQSDDSSAESDSDKEPEGVAI